jgi:2-keto-4-pentenoate hydratase/2-oxohepta-3-ene-1,7-dioic acid hydratase in catechol pathway
MNSTKIVRYQHNKKESYGILTQNSVLSLPLLARLDSNHNFPKTIETFIESEETGLKTAENLLQNANDATIKKTSLPINQAQILAPISHPPKIICLGRNYADHSAEMKAQPPDEPVIFMKPHTAIIGPNQKITKPKFVKELDYEGELAIIIGKKTKNISIEKAQNAIFGYTVFDDVSARDLQFKDGQWTRGKSFDTFAPMGPGITTRLQLANPLDLQLRTWVNGQLRQNSSTKNMSLNVSQIVHHLSKVMTLEPCDVIATGTPSGVGFAMKPPKFLKHGDVIRIEIECIGILENTVEEI